MNFGENFKTFLKTLSVIFTFCFAALLANADEFSSTNYTVDNPVINPGSVSNSTSYSLTGVMSQVGVSESMGSTSHLFGGFLYYPFVSSPVVSATPATEEVGLSWTAASPQFGWTVSGYKVGKSTVSGGPYTYTSTGSGTTYNVSSLTGGTTYYFVVTVLDAFGNQISTSTEVSAVPTAANSGGGGGGGGSSGGGGSYIVATGGVSLSGRAYPGSKVTILKDGIVTASTIADANADFKISISSLLPGAYQFSVFGTDSQGRNSDIQNFPVTVSTGVTVNVGSIFIVPTVALDKSQVKRGDNLAIFGQTVGSGSVTIQVNSDQTIFAKTKADKNGFYLYNLDTAPLEYGDHTAKSKTSISDQISSYSVTAKFKVGTKSIVATTTPLDTKKIVKAVPQQPVAIVKVDYDNYIKANPKKPISLDTKSSSATSTIIDISNQNPATSTEAVIEPEIPSKSSWQFIKEILLFVPKKIINLFR